jgi:hypothetical protein
MQPDTTPGGVIPGQYGEQHVCNFSDVAPLVHGGTPQELSAPKVTGLAGMQEYGVASGIRCTKRRARFQFMGMLGGGADILRGVVVLGVRVRFVGNQDHLRDEAAQMMPVWL